MTGYGKCGAKLILTGEHAVVHGIPAIAIPFNALETSVEVTKINGENKIESVFHTGLLKDGTDKIDGIISLVQHVNNYLGFTNNNLNFKITSNILPQRGLGSSASVSIAVIRAMFDYYHKELTNEVLISLATFAEKIHHANPSGIDVNVLVFNKPVWFIRNKELKLLNLNFSGSIIVVDSKISSKTREAVLNVGERLNNNPDYIMGEFNKIKTSSNDAKVALENNDIKLLGRVLNNNHESLKNIGVSSQVLDLIVSNLLNSGALGAKLTGGGIGGCVIALAKDKAHADLIISNIKGYNAYLYNFGD